MPMFIPMDNPFAGLAVSIVTSNIIDFRDAVACTYSWYTTAGTTDTHTLQVSNNSAEATAAPAASWVAYQTFGTGTPAVNVVDPGIRWGRIIRSVSTASVTIEFSKLVGS